jgi:hypothetical protein
LPRAKQETIDQPDMRPTAHSAVPLIFRYSVVRFQLTCATGCVALGGETRPGVFGDLAIDAKFGVTSKLRGNAGSRSDGQPSKLCATLDLSRRLRMNGTVTLLNSQLDLHASLGTASAPDAVDVRS